MFSCVHFVCVCVCVCVCVWLCARARVHTRGQIFFFNWVETTVCFFMRACACACACACAYLLCMYVCVCACECVLRVHVWACLGTGGHEHRRQRAIIRWNCITVKLRVQWASFLWIGLFFFPPLSSSSKRCACACAALCSSLVRRLDGALNVSGAQCVIELHPSWWRLGWLSSWCFDDSWSSRV